MNKKQKEELLAAYRRFHNMWKDCDHMGMTKTDKMALLAAFESRHPKETALLRAHNVYLEDGYIVGVKGVGLFTVLENELYLSVGYDLLAETPEVFLSPNVRFTEAPSNLEASAN